MINFPSALTEEEEFLKQKYAKLRKKVSCVDYEYSVSFVTKYL